MATGLKTVVATPDSESNDPIWSWCVREGVPYFAGDAENLLQRYIDCAEEFQIDPIVRITADCPFTDPKIILEVVKNFKGKYLNHDKREGQGVEMFTLEELKDSLRIHKYDEHVLASHVEPDWIEFDWVESGEKLSLDTEEDYKRLCSLAPIYRA